MSKVVTIPKDRNPFIVIVNGVEYKYPAGATIEVPDSVADVIEKYEGAKPKPDPNPAPGGGSGGTTVQTDWNQYDSSAADFLKNKPFGDELVEIMPETEVVAEESEDGVSVALDSSLFSGNEEIIIVTFDGVVYECTVNNNFGFGFFGNAKLMGEPLDSGEPFLIAPSVGVILVEDTKPHTLGISQVIRQKLDLAYVNSRTVFYYKRDDEYIYLDKECTTKATRWDVYDATLQGHIVLELWAFDALLYVLTPSFVSNVGECATMTCVLGEGFVYNFYTAEYTPTT